MTNYLHGIWNLRSNVAIPIQRQINPTFHIDIFFNIHSNIVFPFNDSRPNSEPKTLD